MKGCPCHRNAMLIVSCGTTAECIRLRNIWTESSWPRQYTSVVRSSSSSYRGGQATQSQDNIRYGDQTGMIALHSVAHSWRLWASAATLIEDTADATLLRGYVQLSGKSPKHLTVILSADVTSNSSDAVSNVGGLNSPVTAMSNIHELQSMSYANCLQNINCVLWISATWQVQEQ